MSQNQMAQNPNRLKKFTHEKIREQLEKRKDVPDYETYLLKCKISEDSVGIVLDTSSASWRQLQILVRDHERMLQQQSQGNNDDNQLQQQQQSEQPQPTSSSSSSTSTTTMKARSLSSQQQQQQLTQHHATTSIITTSSTPMPSSTILSTASSSTSIDRPKTPTKLEKTPSTYSNSSSTNNNTTQQSSSTTTPQYQQHQTPTKPKPAFTPLVFPRCPIENIKALCNELFILQPGYTGSIYRDDFTPEKLSTRTDPISPFAVPQHLRLSPQISVSAVRKACLHNGIACIPNCLRGMVWAILLDVDLSIFSEQSPSPSTSSSPSPSTSIPSHDIHDDFIQASSSQQQQQQSSLSSQPQFTKNAQDFLDIHAVSTEPEDPSLPPVNGLSVIKVDLHRTYPHLDIFSLQSTQQVMEKLLVKSCRIADLDYKQGMNYLLATLMLVWMPVFSKFSTEDLLQTNNPTSPSSSNTTTPSSSSSSATTTTTTPSQSNINPSATVSTTSPLPNSSFPPSMSNLSTLSTSSQRSSTSTSTSINPFSPASANEQLTTTQQQSSSTSTTSTSNAQKELTNSQAAAIREKHVQYQLKLEGEHFQQVKYPQTADILYQNSSLITASLAQLVSKLLPNTYSDRDFGSLQCLFMFFRLLLQYHDPILSYHLDYHETSPEFYAAPWFLTLHVTRTKDVSIILLLWDHLLLYLRQDPMLHYFISLGLLIDKREILLQQQDTTLPEMLSKMCITSPQHLYTLFLFACQLRTQTPPSASRLLHTISTNTIGSDGDEIDLLTNMLALEVGADESLNQTLGNNRYTYKEMLSSYHNSYYTNLLNKDLTVLLPNQSNTNNNTQLQPLMLATSNNQTNSTPFLFIDCRDEWTFRRGHLSAAINFPLQHLSDPLQREQLLKTIAGFKSMHVCIIHDGLLQPGTDGYGTITPSQWGQYTTSNSSYTSTFNASNQSKTLTALISFLIYEGIRYVSVVSNGWIQIHRTALILGVELVNHSEDKCPICQNPARYDQILNAQNGSKSLPHNQSMLGPPTNNNNNNSSTTSTFGRLQNKSSKNVSLEGNELTHSSSYLGGSSNNSQQSPNTYGNNNNGTLSKSVQQGLFSSISRFFNYTQVPGGQQHHHHQQQQSLSSTTQQNQNDYEYSQQPTNQQQHSFSQPTTSSPLQSNNNSDIFSSQGQVIADDSFAGFIQSENHFDTKQQQQQQSGTVVAQNLDSFFANSTNSPSSPSSPQQQTTSKLTGFGGIHSQSKRQQQQHVQPILTPPSLLHALMISNLRNIANAGYSLRQSLTFCLQQLVTIALDNIDPPFIPNSGYALTGLEYNYSDSANQHNASNKTISDLWIQGRIKTTSIPSTTASPSSPSSAQPPPPYIGYLLQSQLSLIGIVRPLTYMATENTNHVLPLNDKEDNNNNDSSLTSSSSSLDSEPQLYFAHQIMTHILSTVAKQFNEMFLISTGCIEVIPSIPAEDFFDQDSSSTTTQQQQQQQQQRDIEWVPRPISLPGALSSQHVLLFLPVLTLSTASWIITALTFLIEHKNIPPQQLALICITLTKEGFDTVQYAYQQLLTRLHNKQNATNGTTTPLPISKPFIIISTSLAHQEPLNKQPTFVSNAQTQKSLFNKDDEHCDVYPSIPQLYARYLQKGE